jgi:hypothetical protein
MGGETTFLRLVAARWIAATMQKNGESHGQPEILAKIQIFCWQPGPMPGMICRLA